MQQPFTSLIAFVQEYLLRRKLNNIAERYNPVGPWNVRKELFDAIQNNNCRHILSTVQDGDALANAFLCASVNNHMELLEAFLDNGMNIDVKNTFQNTALMWASRFNHIEQINRLLDRNANMDIQDDCGQTALCHATGAWMMVAVKILLERNANPDIPNSKGETILMMACASRNAELVELLLHHNADIELRNADGKTALDLATNQAIKKMLQNHVSCKYVLK